ncbi:hypothetical protein KL941_001190 [Ogataea angusta]|nr:hypothetical protein KL941_001190 [Ogataea angusta]
MNSRVFFKSDTYDPSSELPLYVLDTTLFPSLSNERQIAQLAERIVSQMPAEDYCLVLLAGGFCDYDNDHATTFKMPLNLVKLFNLIPSQNKRYLYKVYLVHGSNWIVKSVVDFFKRFWNFTRQIAYCENLSILAQHVDITKIPISLTCYLVDKIVYSNDRIILNRQFPKIYGVPLNLSHGLAFKQFSKIYNNLLSYMTTKHLDKHLTPEEWLTLIKGGQLKQETLVAVEIFSDALSRDQRLCLSDFSFLEHYLILERFIAQLSESDQPLIPLDVLTKYNYDFSRLEDLNTAFGELLSFKYPVSKRPALKSLDNSAPVLNVQRLNYDNSYILVKLVVLMRRLVIKLSHEETEPHAKNITQMKERQNLRLILSFTKILYNERANQELDNGFDTLFKFLCSLFRNYDKVLVKGNQLRDFENLISMDDILDFEKKGVTDSPMERKIAYKVRVTEPPTPPVARKAKDRKPEIEVDGQFEDFVFESGKQKVSDKLRNELLRPSEQLTSKLVKYTEKDLLFQQSQQKTRDATGRFRVARGRNVSRLTQLYEQKLLGTF